ncbi:MAG: 5-(carboxyamino)imidazole ribonucleotide synthase [Hyphomicrobiales bacterium]|nr:5-(carboxyamino)imidazole ribonucleotide synthase [Hyphomicrobiales bacterium]
MADQTVLGPGATIGILGGGQLGRMLALAAARLGLKCHIYSPEGDNPAFDVADMATPAGYDDTAALAEFARSVDVATYEFENVPLPAASLVEGHVPLYPPPAALEVSQHRVNEKTFFNDAGIATAGWLHAQTADELVEMTAGRLGSHGARGIMKTCRLGYDGKGQARVSSNDDVRRAWDELGGQDLIFEWLVPFAREVSVIAARAATGAVEVFDIAENTHENGILRTSRVPAGISPSARRRAQEIATLALERLDYIGVIAIELFVVETDAGEELLVNEFAPRVHNSGHWTEAACAVSQFEQHIRAIAGWPLGDPRRHSDAEMHNLLGEEVNDWPDLAGQTDTVVHIYGKAACRPGRKMGHVTHLSPLSER